MILNNEQTYWKIVNDFNEWVIFNLIILDKTNQFTQKEISPIFSEITDLTGISKNIQNYIRFAFKNNKQDLIPLNFVEFIINSIDTNGISEQAKICLNAFSCEQLSSNNRKKLTNKISELITYLNSRLQYGSSDITTTLANTI